MLFAVWLFGFESATSVAETVLEAGVDFKMLDGVRVGHVRQSPREMHTLSVDPPIFLLPRLLSDADVNELITHASSMDWEESGVSHVPIHVQNDLRKGGPAAEKVLRAYDTDNDKSFGKQELEEIAYSIFNVPNYDNATHAALVAHVSPKLARSHPGGSVPLKKLQRANLPSFFRELLEEEPHLANRYSQHTWLPHHTKVVQKVLAHAEAVSGLPRSIVNMSEPLQVVRYQVNGHYACHHDSSDATIAKGDVRLATLGIFLKPPAIGGELAFPGVVHGGTNNFSKDDVERECQKTEKCLSLGDVIIRPRKGDAVFWYNARPESWAASEARRKVPNFASRALIWKSLHCGAKVLQGEKWFANLWLRAKIEIENAGEQEL